MMLIYGLVNYVFDDIRGLVIMKMFSLSILLSIYHAHLFMATCFQL